MSISVAESETAFELAVSAHVQRTRRSTAVNAGIDTFREMRACAFELAAAHLHDGQAPLLEEVLLLRRLAKKARKK